MKVEVIKEEKRTESKYPYIGSSDSGGLVLFNSPRTGIALNDSILYKQGFQTDSWNEENFTPLEIKITLQND